MILRSRRAVPEFAAAALTRAQRRAPFVLTGSAASIHATDEALVVVEDGAIRTVPWYQLQQAKFDADQSQLVLTWVDPASPPTTFGVTDGDVDKFMGAIRAIVARTVVVETVQSCPSGAKVHVLIRRGEGEKLFSTVSAERALHTPADVQFANQLEANLRESVGL